MRNIIELLYIGGKRYSAEHSNLVTHVMCPILNKNYHVRYQLSFKLEMLEFQITYDGLLEALILLLLDIVVMQSMDVAITHNLVIKNEVYKTVELA